MLDGLAVAVPAGHVGREEPALRMGLVHEVLEDLVEGMADMDGAVGVRRAVVQDEGLAVLVLLENLLVDMLFFPLGQTLRLALGRLAASRSRSSAGSSFLCTCSPRVPYLSSKHVRFCRHKPL